MGDEGKNFPESVMPAVQAVPIKNRGGRPRKKVDEQRQYLEKYAGQAKAAGCPIQQIWNFINASVILQPKQLKMAAAARLCDLEGGPTAIGVGGARGGSKTHWIVSQIGADDCQRYPGLKVLFLRKVAKANREQFNDFRMKIYSRLKHKYREQAGILQFENGSTIVIGHFKDEKDIDNYLGLEYDVIAVEEATTLSFEKWKNIMSCLRTSKPGWRPRSYASWNWGGVGHFWAKKLFWEPMVEKREKETRFIRSTIYDNVFVNKEYKQYLESLTGWKRKSWLEGDPNFQAGQFFTTWNEETHVLKAYDEKGIRRWVGALDYGRTHPTVFLLGGQDREGRLMILDEHSEAGMTIEEHSECIRGLLRRHGIGLEDLDYFVAGKDCFSVKDDGTTIADTYEENGITMTPAEIDRINGWARVLDKLGDPEKGIKPTLFVHEKCRNLVEQIPLAQHHEKRPEDVEKMNADENGEGGDDALDCLRFLVSSDPGTAIKFARPLAVGRYQLIGC